jgi:hypothetical protein
VPGAPVGAGVNVSAGLLVSAAPVAFDAFADWADGVLGARAVEP